MLGVARATDNQTIAQGPITTFFFVLEQFFFVPEYFFVLLEQLKNISKQNKFVLE